jgi:hypothetical protein
MANVFNTKPELLQEFCGHLAKPGDETVVLYADGKPLGFWFQTGIWAAVCTCASWI